MPCKMWSRAPLPADIYHVAENMRADDWAEIALMRENRGERSDFAAGIYRMQPYAIFSQVYGLDGDPRATVFLGIWPANEYRTLASAALFATPDFSILARVFVRHLRRFVAPALLADGVRRMECRTLASYTAAHRLLHALGAVEETVAEGSPDFGPGGESFKLFAWRRRDWVK